MKKSIDTVIYTCPMHPDVKASRPEKCSKCGMQLVKMDAISEKPQVASANSYKPLIIIIGLLCITSIILSIKDLYLGNFQINKSMSYFMGGFFIVFSGFKLLDIHGFAEGYATYDVLAQKIFSYGYIYPLLELFLGFLYLLQVFPPIVLFFTFFVMTFSGVGVLIKITKHEKFHCACLGTFLKVPLTKVTLVEDFGMALMALAMFVMR